MISELELAVIKRGLSQDFSILTVCLKSHYYLLHIYVYTKSRAYRRAIPQTIDSLPVGSQITMRCCTTMMVRIATSIAREHCCFNLVYIYQTWCAVLSTYGRLNLAGTVVKSQEFLAVIQKCNVWTNYVAG